MFAIPSAAARLLIGACLCAYAALPLAAELPDFISLVEKNSPAVVKISAVSKSPVDKTGRRPPPPFNMPGLPENSPFNEQFRRFFEQLPEGRRNFRQPPSQGSGFIISEDGYVITNHHVVKNTEQVLVRLNDRREFIAEVIGADERSDIALLRIDGKDLPVLQLGSSADLKVGEWVLAIGSPFGFDYSVTQGIISAIGRNLPNENYVPFIQTDVAINPGNSGGPLFNLDGQVIGVNSQIFSGTGGYMGVSFAVPIDVVKNVYTQLRTKGKVARGWLGVLIQDVTRELAESFGMDKPMGALVARVLDGSPAAAAGFEVGDVIVRYDGNEVAFSSDLPPMVGATGVDKKVPVKIIRRGNSETLQVVIAELPEEDNALAQRTPPDQGSEADNAMKVVVTDLTDAMRASLDLPQGGVLVKQALDGPARQAGIREGDVIVIVNNKRIKDAADFTQLVAELPRNKSIPVLIQRRGAPTFLALRLE